MAETFKAIIDAHRDVTFYVVIALFVGIEVPIWLFAISQLMRTIIDWRKMFPKKKTW